MYLLIDNNVVIKQHMHRVRNMPAITRTSHIHELAPHMSHEAKSKSVLKKAVKINTLSLHKQNKTSK